MFPHPQADHGRQGDEVGAGRVGNGRAGLERFAVPLARHAHEAGQGLGQRVNARSAAVGTVLAKGADRNADNLGIILAVFLVGDAQLGFGLGAQIIHNDVGGADQPKIQRLALGLGQVEHNAALIAVDAEVEAAVVFDFRTDGPRLIAVRRLDLDHVRAHIAEHGGAVGAGQHAGDIQHPNSCQR